MFKFISIFLFVSLFLTGCGAAEAIQVTPPELTGQEIVVWGWPEDQLPEVFADFTEKSHIRVVYESYAGQEQAIKQLKDGASPDLVLLDNQLIQSLISENRLAKIDLGNVPNIYGISSEFLDHPFDPGNHYTIPYTWGTTGLLVRTDLVSKPVNSWADLWDPEYSGKIVLWKSTPRHTAAVALMLLGYSINTEKAAELEKAMLKLKDLKDRAIWFTEEESSADLLSEGGAVLAMGWSYDAILAKETSDTIDYLLPGNGAILWADSFVIPDNAPHPREAEQFLNYILDAEVSGKLMNLNYYAMPNPLAMPFVEPDLSRNKIIFPSNEFLGDYQIIQPLSSKGDELFNAIWEKVLGF